MLNSVLKDKHILITGATDGIGLATAELCLNQGAVVWINGRDQDKLNATVKRLGSNAIGMCYDVTDEKAVQQAFRKIQSDAGALDGLVNNAGVMLDAALVMTSLRDLQQMLQVNVVAAYQHLQLACRLMTRKKSGSIVNLASLVGEQGSAGQTAYATTKAALSGMTKAAAKEVAKLNIRVNAVAPGFIATNLTEHYQNQQRQAVIDSIGLGRVGASKDVAQQIVFLLSEQCAYTTGQILSVDGGLQL